MSVLPVPSSPRKVLVIDHHADSRQLLTRSLYRKFPRTTVIETDNSGDAATALATESIEVIVLHRTYENDAIELLKELRKINATVPMVVVSGSDRNDAALAAGANAFLHYDRWLLVGSVVAQVMVAAQMGKSSN